MTTDRKQRLLDIVVAHAIVAAIGALMVALG